MIQSVTLVDGRLRTANGVDPAALWVDLRDASAEEQHHAAATLSQGLPQRPKLRAGAGDGPLDLAIDVLAEEATGAVCRVLCRLTPQTLVTVHQAPEALSVAARVRLEEANGRTPVDALFALMEASAEAIAERLSAVRAELDAVSAEVFAEDAPHQGAAVRRIVRHLGRLGTATQRVADGLASLSFALALLKGRGAPDGFAADVATLSARAAALDSKIDFQLNAALGLIAHDQNTVTVVLSVTAALFLPPTLIASVFGMNFADVPGLRFHHAFFLCVAAMVLAAVGMAAILRLKRWL